MPLRETLAAASSRLNSEALATRVVLAHPCAAFHPCTCGLNGSVVTVAAALIGYDDMEVDVRTTTRRRWSWTTTSTPMRGYVGSLLQLFFHCSTYLVVTIHDLLLTSILEWHDRSSASVTYLFSYKYGSGFIPKQPNKALPELHTLDGIYRYTILIIYRFVHIENKNTPMSNFLKGKRKAENMYKYFSIRCHRKHIYSKPRCPHMHAACSRRPEIKWRKQKFFNVYRTTKKPQFWICASPIFYCTA
jgi:hypothetical protein